MKLYSFFFLFLGILIHSMGASNEQLIDSKVNQAVNQSSIKNLNWPELHSAIYENQSELALDILMRFPEQANQLVAPPNYSNPSHQIISALNKAGQNIESIKWSALWLAIERNMVPLVEELLKRGQDPNKFSTIIGSCNNKVIYHQDTEEEIWDMNFTFYRPLAKAIEMKSIEMTSLLFQYGARLGPIIREVNAMWHESYPQYNGSCFIWFPRNDAYSAWHSARNSSDFCDIFYRQAISSLVNNRYAAEEIPQSVVDLYKKLGDSPHEDGLLVALNNGETLQNIDLLLEYGGNSNSALEYCLRNSNPDYFNILKKYLNIKNDPRLLEDTILQAVATTHSDGFQWWLENVDLTTFLSSEYKVRIIYDEMFTKHHFENIQKMISLGILPQKLFLQAVQKEDVEVVKFVYNLKPASKVEVIEALQWTLAKENSNSEMVEFLIHLKSNFKN